jgi:hypothetical protein
MAGWFSRRASASAAQSRVGTPMTGMQPTANPKASVSASRRGEIPWRSQPAALRLNEFAKKGTFGARSLLVIDVATMYTIRHRKWISFSNFRVISHESFVNEPKTASGFLHGLIWEFNYAQTCIHRMRIGDTCRAVLGGAASDAWSESIADASHNKALWAKADGNNPLQLR